MRRSWLWLLRAGLGRMTAPLYVASLQALAARQADALRLATARIEALEEENKALRVDADWLAVVSSDEARDEALAWLRSQASFFKADRDRWRERAWTETARRLGLPGLWGGV